MSKQANSQVQPNSSAKPSTPSDAELRAQAAESRLKQQPQQAPGPGVQQQQQGERALNFKPQQAQQAQQAGKMLAQAPAVKVLLWLYTQLSLLTIWSSWY